MTIQRTQRGDPITADHDNAKIDALNHAGRPALGPRSDFGAVGTMLERHHQTIIAYFRLTECVICPPPGGSSSSGSGDEVCDDEPAGWNSYPDVPYTYRAQRLWLHHKTNKHVAEALDTYLHTEETVLYFPTARDDHTLVAGFEPGDIVAAFDNEQSGRWDVLGWPKKEADCECCASSSSSSSSSGESSSSSSSGESSSSSSSSSSGSSSGECLTCFGGGEGLCLDDLSVETDPDYVLGVKDGCLVLVPTSLDCDSSSGA